MPKLRSFFARDGVNFTLVYLAAFFCGVGAGSGLQEWKPAVTSWFGFPVTFFLVLAIWSSSLRRRKYETFRDDMTAIKDEAQAQLDDLLRQMGAWSTMKTMVPDGAIVGRVFIVPRPDAAGGSIEIDVKEKTPLGGWMDVKEYGPVAVVLAELAEELRRRAMDDAAEQ